MTDREKAIVMAYTGFTMLAGDKLGLYYEYVREKLGHSVMTHEFAYPEVQDAVKEAAREDFIALAKAPAVDAAPVVHGRWTYFNCVGEGRYQCSECLHWVDAGTDRNYCPNCGARMDGEAHEH